MTETSRQARWHAALVVALATCLLAVAFGLPTLFFLAIVALGFVLVEQVSATPDIGGLGVSREVNTPTDDRDETDDRSSDAGDEGSDDANGGLRIERTLEDDRVRPGRSVTVTISVTNEGATVVPDARLVDEPPAEVPVTDGSPAVATAVRPGETVSHEYELTPPRGEFEFGEVTVRLRSASASGVVTAACEPDGDDGFTCETLLDSFPFHDRTIQFVGRAPTDDGGSGIEFFSTREYRRGDPINRIDWHRFARTRDLTTVEYREERAVTVVFVIDDRPNGHRSLPGGGPDSFDLTLYAASRGVVASLEEGNRTGLTTLQGDDWIEPGTGRGVRRRIDDALDDPSATAFDSKGIAQSAVADGGTLVAELERRLPRRAQVAFCTPLLDDEGVDLVSSLRTRGRAVTVLSPDVPADRSTSASPGTRIAGCRRRNRLDALRGLGVTVVDWDLESPISVALTRAFRAGTGRGRSV